METTANLASVGRVLTPLLNFTRGGYAPPPYVVPDAVSSSHNRPRYGFTNDFSALIGGDDDQIREYVLGVIIGALIILGVAVVWFLAILCLKIAGWGRVGFLAGRFVRPDGARPRKEEGVEVVAAAGNGDGEDGVDEGVTVNESIMFERKFTRKVWAARAIFVLSGVAVMISGGLFYGRGVASFNASLDDVRDGLYLVQSAAHKGIYLTENVLQAEEAVERDMEPGREVAESMGGEICGLDSETSRQIRDAYDGLSSNVDRLTAMLDGALESFGDDLRNLVSLTEDIDSSLNSADVVFYVLVVISVVEMCLVLALIAGVFFAWKGVSNCFTKCIQYAVIWPLFVFFLILSWIFATLFLILSLAGADFCVSPDQFMEVVLNSNKDIFGGVIFGFIIFYVSGCTIMPAGEDAMIEIAEQLKLVLNYAHDLTGLVGELPIERIAILCGLNPTEAAAVRELTVAAHDSTHVLNRAFVGLRDVLSCETFNPIYTTFVHEAFCVQGVSGLAHIFSTTLAISVFSMVMIMFRAALYPVRGDSAGSASEIIEYHQNANSSGGDEDVADEKPIVY